MSGVRVETVNEVGLFLAKLQPLCCCFLLVPSTVYESLCIELGHEVSGKEKQGVGCLGSC